MNYSGGKLFRKAFSLYSRLMPGPAWSPDRFLLGVETIRFLLERHCSFARYGDGEIALMLGGSIRYQQAEPLLAQQLRALLLEGPIGGGVLVGLPARFLIPSRRELLESGRYPFWRTTRRYLAPHRIRDVWKGKFGDAFVFRPESEVSLGTLSQLWHNRPVILAVPQEKWFRDFKAQWPASVWVPVPPTDAFSHVQALRNSILQKARTGDHALGEVRVLIAAGPAAKVLVRELTAEGLVAYDVGNFFTWKFYGKRKRVRSR